MRNRTQRTVYETVRRLRGALHPHPSPTFVTQPPTKRDKGGWRHTQRTTHTAIREGGLISISVAYRDKGEKSVHQDIATITCAVNASASVADRWWKRPKLKLTCRVMDDTITDWQIARADFDWLEKEKFQTSALRQTISRVLEFAGVSEHLRRRAARWKRNEHCVPEANRHQRLLSALCHAPRDQT